jgi:hypothetical protein
MTEEIKTQDEVIKESVDFGALFEGTEITEEVKTKITTIFEAALAVKVEAEVATIQEEFEVKFNETLDEVKAELVEKIDSFLDYAVEEWVDQNRVALESGIRNEITENFILGLKELFTENFIEVPEEKFDLVGEMESKIDEVTEELDAQLAKNVALNSKINTLIKESIVQEVVLGLTAVDADKLKTMVESVDFESESTYKEKLVTLRENYFPKAGKPKSLVEDTANVEDKPVVHNDIVSRYVAGWIK